MKIELKTKNLCGFDEERAKELLKRHIEAIKHYWRWCERRGIREGWGHKGYAKENYKKEIQEILNDGKQQEYILQEYADVRDAIKERRLVVRFVGGLYWTTGIMVNNQIRGLSLMTMKVLCPYHLNYDKRAYRMSVYGTSRPLEIILSYGYALGLSFKDIPQDQQILD